MSLGRIGMMIGMSVTGSLSVMTATSFSTISASYAGWIATAETRMIRTSPDLRLPPKATRIDDA